MISPPTPSRTSRSLILAFGLVMGLFAHSGCYSPIEPGVALSGRVTYQGRPILDGMIYFEPEVHTPSRTAACRIVNGRYSISSEVGPQPGDFRVEIIAAEPTSEAGSSGPKVVIPTKYNTATELRITIPKRKSYTYLIDLK